MTLPTIAAIEAGGTKFVISVCRGDQLGERIIVPTADPETTLSSVVDAITQELQGDMLSAVGIPSFGPIDIDPISTHLAPLVRRQKGLGGVNLRECFSARLTVQSALSQT